MLSSEKIVEGIGAGLRATPPAGVSAAYVEGFLARNRAALVGQLQRTLDQAQILAAQTDRLGTWREDHRLLRAAMAQLRQHVDVARERVVAGWLLRHAENEERALAGMWTHSSRELEASRHRAHIAIEHRTLGAALRAVLDGGRFSGELHDEMDHHLREEEAAIPYLRPATFPYAPCGITQADINDHAA